MTFVIPEWALCVGGTIAAYFIIRFVVRIIFAFVLVQALKG